jgi:alcohol dehydrogenase
MKPLCMTTYKALVYHGEGRKGWETASNPTIQQPRDAIVQIIKTTICGIDLHILKGGVPEVTNGTEQFYAPEVTIMIDPDENRLAMAKRFGATKTINYSTENAVDREMTMTQGIASDTAIEAVGIPATFELCQSLVAQGGTIANIGVHGKSAEIHLESFWAKNITITTRLVDTVSMPILLKAMRARRLNVQQLITHHFKLSDIITAYDTFQHATEPQALKVLLTNDEI